MRRREAADEMGGDDQPLPGHAVGEVKPIFGHKRPDHLLAGAGDARAEPSASKSLP